MNKLLAIKTPTRFDSTKLPLLLTPILVVCLLFPTSSRASDAGFKNIREGIKFMKDNKEEEGVKETKSGLQYKVLKKGRGKRPSKTDTVSVHYEGRLLDGTVFDSSFRRGEPATFPLNKVIAGWTEGLTLMREGSKYRLFVPSKLAYGQKGAGRSIGPNQTLIFDIELLEVNPSS